MDDDRDMDDGERGLFLDNEYTFNICKYGLRMIRVMHLKMTCKLDWRRERDYIYHAESWPNLTFAQLLIKLPRMTFRYQLEA